jgi:hypothetical protein
MTTEPPPPPSEEAGSAKAGSIRWYKVAVGAITALIVIVIMAAAAGCSDEDPTGGSGAEAGAEQAEQAGQEGADDEAAPEPEAEPAPAAPEHMTFGSGDFRVPQDIKRGTYRTREASPGCYWEIKRDFSGDINSIIANDNASGPAIVTLGAAAKGFSSDGCAEWTDDLSQITASKNRFEEGTYFVRTDIAPGSYRSSGGGGCYWARLSGFDGGTGNIIANDLPSGAAIVEIAASDKGFNSTGCGTWSK